MLKVLAFYSELKKCIIKYILRTGHRECKYRVGESKGEKLLGRERRNGESEGERLHPQVQSEEASEQKYCSFRYSVVGFHNNPEDPACNLKAAAFEFEGPFI